MLSGWAIFCLLCLFVKNKHQQIKSHSYTSPQSAFKWLFTLEVKIEKKRILFITSIHPNFYDAFRVDHKRFFICNLHFLLEGSATAQQLRAFLLKWSDATWKSSIRMKISFLFCVAFWSNLECLQLIIVLIVRMNFFEAFGAKWFFYLRLIFFFVGLRRMKIFLWIVLFIETNKL